MIIKQLKDEKDFTQSEKDVATYILEHIEEIHSFTANTLAKKTFTSKATIIRFCKKLNFNGYSEFIRQLTLEIGESGRLLKLLSNEPLSTQTKMSELMELVPSIYEKAISETKLLANPTIIVF